MTSHDSTTGEAPTGVPPAAVLFDRDATLIVDVPYNGDPAAVRPMPGALDAVAAVRAAGVPIGVVSNQSGIARGLLTAVQVEAVNARVDALFGGFDTWQYCPHGPEDGCDCRKPKPGLVLRAAAALGVDPRAHRRDRRHRRRRRRRTGCRRRRDPRPDADHAAGGGRGRARGRSRPARCRPARPGRGRPMTRVLVARLDSMGDVLVSGPAVRAIAASGDEVVLLAGPQGAAAARLLPGVAEVHVLAAPWLTSTDRAVDAGLVQEVADLVAATGVERAVLLTSFHQSPLPLALLLRLAGVRDITGASVDAAGGLLDVRLIPGEDLEEDQPEPLRALAIAAAAGYRLPEGADDGLAVELSSERSSAAPAGTYVVVHPGAAVPARAYPADLHAQAVAELTARGRTVVVTGAPAERTLTAEVAGAHGIDLGGALDLAGLAALLRDADVVVTGNTGPAHLAAAVRTPVVSLFAPVVPEVRWAPWGVPVALLGDQEAPCRNTRARVCPVPGHPCLSSVAPATVVDAAERLIASTKAGAAA